MDKVRDFIIKYRGAVIGIIVAILFLIVGLYKIIIPVILIVLCAILGNYIQQNKDDVKEKIKNIIDKM